MTLPCALTIAGSDSGGGAGIQADLRTFAALGVFGTSALTAITAQNTVGVHDVELCSPRIVQAQIEAVLKDLPIKAAKTGMLGSAAIIEATALALGRSDLPLVVDPVMVSKSGAALLADDAVDALLARIVPRATLLTPNLAEATRLVGFAVRTVDDQQRAAVVLRARGARAVLVKGGHAEGDPVDVLDTGDGVHHFFGTRIETRHTHGTGCTYAAAIAAYLARGWSLVDAVTHAHRYVRRAIEEAPGLGRGHGPLHHMHTLYDNDGVSRGVDAER
jgi:hydroxymethylpyrimidine/phosphomethylpyrimidine kinase